MRWEKEAETLLKRIPFFVRGRVKKRVEAFVRERGKNVVTKEELLLAKKALREKEARVEEGFSVEGCFGATGCPNAVTSSLEMLAKIEELLKEAGLTEFLRQKVKGPLKHHHQFRVALSECPNACSQVQIKDVALIGRIKLGLEPEKCVFCGECEKVCEERALVLSESGPVLNEDKCVGCGACIKICPEGALLELKRGYRVLLGGKLGRHPRLAQEILPLASEEEVLALLKKVVSFYQKHNQQGERLGALFERLGWEKAFEELKK